MNGSGSDAGGPSRASWLLRELTGSYVHESSVDETLRHVSNLVGSAISSAPSLNGIDSIVQALITRLVRDGRHNDAMRFSDLAAVLRVSPEFSNSSLWAMLYVLSDLKGTSAEEPSRPRARSKGNGTLAHPPRRVPSSLLTGDNAVPTLSKTPFVPAAPDNESGSENKIYEPIQVDDTEDSGSEEFEENGSLVKEAKENTNPISTGSTRHIKAAPAHSIAYERILLRDLLLVVQGEDGRSIRFAGNPDDEQIEFGGAIEKKLSQPMLDIARAVAELGFLFRVVRRRIDEVNEEAHGFVLVNFCHAIDKELDAYYKSIVSLRASLNVKDNPLKENPMGQLTIRRLYAWSESEKERMRCLARLCEEMRQLKGGQVLAHLRTYRTSFLAPEIQSMLSHIFARAASPLNRMLQRWLTEGILDDPHQEFFIMVDPKVAAAAAAAAALIEEGTRFGSLSGGPNAASGASNRIWWGLYKLRYQMLPSSRKRGLAEKALVAGKSVAFLRRCCNDSVWVDTVHAPSLSEFLPGTSANSHDKEMLGFVGLEKLVEKADLSASKRLMTLFFDKFDLSHHFAAIKKYLLLSQGDFTQSLIGSLARILDGDNAILLNSVTGLVDTALRSASSFNEETDQDILERLNVKILRQTSEKRIGWDIFSLTYRVEDAPLNTVFSSKVMDAYLLIFRFLWRLKRMDHLLSQSYVSLCAHKETKGEDFTNTERFVELTKSLRKAHYLRMKMTHLVQNLEYYCTFEVLEGSWTVLERDMSNAASLSSLIDAHSRYLTAIKDRTLLSEKSRGVLQALNATLDTIPVFHQAQQRLSRELNSFSVRSKSVGEDRISPKSFAVEPALHAGLVDVERPVANILEDIEGDFDENFSYFLDALHAHANTVDNCLFLAFRLDYNGYFSAQKAALSE